MSKFVGKFRKNNAYEDYEASGNFVKIRRHKNEDQEPKKVKNRNHDNNHKRYGFQEGWDG